MIAELFNVVMGVLGFFLALATVIGFPLWLLRKYGARLRAWYLRGFQTTCIQCDSKFTKAPDICPDCMIRAAVRAATEKMEKDWEEKKRRARGESAPPPKDYAAAQAATGLGSMFTGNFFGR